MLVAWQLLPWGSSCLEEPYLEFIRVRVSLGVVMHIPLQFSISRTPRTEDQAVPHTVFNTMTVSFGMRKPLYT